MSAVWVVIAIGVLTGWVVDNTHDSSTTGAPLTPTSVATTETTVPPLASTTSSTIEPQQDDAGESIGVTDKVTIIITDPQDSE